MALKIHVTNSVLAGVQIWAHKLWQSGLVQNDNAVHTHSRLLANTNKHKQQIQTQTQTQTNPNTKNTNNQKLWQSGLVQTDNGVHTQRQPFGKQFFFLKKRACGE